MLCTVILTTAAATAVARADSYDTIAQAVVTTLHEPSYHFSMTMPGTQSAEGDVVTPDRMHMTMPLGESTIIGKTVYMKMNGVWKKFDVNGLMPSPTDEMKKMAAGRADTTVDDLGMRTVDGSLMHAYKITNAKKKTTSTVFIDHAGRIAREDIATTVFRMSKFGEAVSIAAPM
jgi:flavin-binding protein dodecin